MIRWLFFDLGSTLVDESLCDEYRLSQLARQPGAPPPEVIVRMARENAAANRHPYRDTARDLGLPTVPWPARLERLYPDTVPVLQALSGRYSLGIIANQSPGGATRCEEFGIAKYFSLMVFSAEAGAAKPDPAIFTLALNAAGCRPGEAVMIGDRPDNDIAPAAALGLHTVWLRRGSFSSARPERAGIRPDMTVLSLSDLLELL